MASTPSDRDTITIRKDVTTKSPSQRKIMDTYLRIRPLTDSEKSDDDNETCVEVQSNKDVILKAPVSSETFKNNPRDSDRRNTKFTFTKIFGPNTHQLDFFLEVVDATVQDFVNGKNCLVFAYGATNSGKTHTLQGSPQNPGVIPNALEVIFHVLKDHQMQFPRYRPGSSAMIEELTPKDQREERVSKETLIAGIPEGAAHYSSRETMAEDQPSIVELSGVKITQDVIQNSSFLIYVSFAEIYNEQFFDLLSHPSERQKLALVNDSEGHAYINGLKKVWVSTVEEGLKVFHLGRRNLHMEATKLNEQSSRSHCVFTIYVIRVVESATHLNHLSICDLAGSERTGKAMHTGDRLKEAGKINTSLMVLGRCIGALRLGQLGNQKDKSPVPFRESKLTHLLKALFSGQLKASMIVNVAPSCFMFDDTLQVMKFSALAKQVLAEDRTEHSIHRFNIWVKSKQHHPKIPATSVNQTPLAKEEEEDDECTEQYIKYLLEDIKTQTTYSEALEAKVKEYKRKNLEAELEKQKSEDLKLVEKCQQLQTDLDSAKSQNENFQSELTFVKSENKELTEQLKNLEVANEQLKLDNSRLIEKYEQPQKVNSTEVEEWELQLKEESDQENFPTPKSKAPVKTKSRPAKRREESTSSNESPKDIRIPLVHSRVPRKKLFQGNYNY